MKNPSRELHQYQILQRLCQILTGLFLLGALASGGFTFFTQESQSNAQILIWHAEQIDPLTLWIVTVGLLVAGILSYILSKALRAPKHDVYQDSVLDHIEHIGRKILREELHKVNKHVLESIRIHRLILLIQRDMPYYSARALEMASLLTNQFRAIESICEDVERAEKIQQETDTQMEKVIERLSDLRRRKDGLEKRATQQSEDFDQLRAELTELLQQLDETQQTIPNVTPLHKE